MCNQGEYTSIANSDAVTRDLLVQPLLSDIHKVNQLFCFSSFRDVSNCFEFVILTIVRRNDRID